MDRQKVNPLPKVILVIIWFCFRCFCVSLFSFQSGNLWHKLVTYFFTSKWILMTFPGCECTKVHRMGTTEFVETPLCRCACRLRLGFPCGVGNSDLGEMVLQGSVFLPSGPTFQGARVDRRPSRRASPRRARPGVFVKAPGPLPERALEACPYRCGLACYSVCGKGAGGTAQENAENRSGFFMPEPGVSRLLPASLDRGSFCSLLVEGDISDFPRALPRRGCLRFWAGGKAGAVLTPH